MSAKLSYDEDAGAAYVKLSDEPVARTLTDWLAEGVNLDIDGNGDAVGIEFLDAELVAPKSRNPLDYTCPNCNAQPGKMCSVPTSTSRRQVPWVHPSREELAE